MMSGLEILEEIDTVKTTFIMLTTPETLIFGISPSRIWVATMFPPILNMFLIKPTILKRFIISVTLKEQLKCLLPCVNKFL